MLILNESCFAVGCTILRDWWVVRDLDPCFAPFNTNIGFVTCNFWIKNKTLFKWLYFYVSSLTFLSLLDLTKTKLLFDFVHFNLDFFFFKLWFGIVLYCPFITWLAALILSIWLWASVNVGERVGGCACKKSSSNSHG